MKTNTVHSAGGSLWSFLARAFIIGLGSIVLLSPVMVAQEGDEGSPDEEVATLEAFSVLGSSITRFDEETGLPVTKFDMEQLETEGFSSSGEIFTELVFSGSPEFDESQDGPNDARGDVTSVNLRNAGPGQTLMLLNGRRLAPHPLNQTVGSVPSVLVNANVVPAGLIDRIDILRDGASAIYGTDASAGVVNTTLDDEYLGNQIRFRYGTDENDFSEWFASFKGGFEFNEGKTNLTFFGSYFERDPIFATSRAYAVNGDKRPLVEEKWRSDVSIINVSSGSVYSNFETDLPGSRDELSQNGTAITDGTGRFHLNPPGSGGATAVLVGGQEIDGGSLPREERYDFAPFRTLTSEVTRANLFATLNHEISETLNLFGELGYYDSSTYQERAAVVIGTSDALVIPAQNYWNPFGPVTFADGRANPNRLSGITLQNGDPLPDEGIALRLRGWRAEDLGLRLVDVDSDSFLATIGLEGIAMNEWYWNTGVRYNLNQATDTSRNRLSKTGLEAALANDTPSSLNVFAGPGVNSPDQFNDLLIEVSRTAETEMLVWDLNVNNPDIFELFGNPLGVAFGATARYESYKDDRDPRIDGTIRFDDTPQGASDVIGVSPTPDSESDRNVYGLYAEALVPIVGEANRMPGIHRLELQVAGRFEDYSDFGNVTKPKLGGLWYVTPDVLVRGSFAQGFTAPNLSLLTNPIQRFNTGVVDDYRIQWDPNNSENDGSEQTADLRGGNTGLGPENSETVTFGFVWRVNFIEGLTLTADYWDIQIKDRIGTLGTGDIINFDTAILNGLSADPGAYSPGQTVTGDPRVERGPIDQGMIDLATGQGFAPAGPINRIINPFVNLAQRNLNGYDFGFEYLIPWEDLGRFRLSGTASYLKTLEDIEEEGDIPINRIKDEINPEWRANLSLSWRNGPWSAGWSLSYLSETIDNDVDSDDGEEWVIDEYWRNSIRGGYSFDDGMLSGLDLSLGIRNLFNREPSLNPDESIGYESSLHSNRERFYYVDLKYAF
jgi:iron complex outermembrane receptor protein